MTSDMRFAIPEEWDELPEFLVSLRQSSWGCVWRVEAPGFWLGVKRYPARTSLAAGWRPSVKWAEAAAFRRIRRIRQRRWRDDAARRAVLELPVPPDEASS